MSLDGKRAVARMGLLCVLALFPAACDDSPASPTTATWNGIIDDRALGRGSLQVVFSDPAQQLGTWNVGIGAPPPSGSVSQLPAAPGSPATQRVFVFSCGPAPGGGTLVLTANVATGSIDGTYFTAGCSTPTTGSVQLTRR